MSNNEHFTTIADWLKAFEPVSICSAVTAQELLTALDKHAIEYVDRDSGDIEYIYLSQYVEINGLRFALTFHYYKKVLLTVYLLSEKLNERYSRDSFHLSDEWYRSDEKERAEYYAVQEQKEKAGVAECKSWLFSMYGADDRIVDGEARIGFREDIKSLMWSIDVQYPGNYVKAGLAVPPLFESYGNES